ncbi:NUDIX hydrolase [Pseudomonas aeruginosa]|uniref:NUDIX hydrolase n=1 Tax=Pseudomonas aeruginosa TaxID=287 RepID=UPI00062C1DFA|nr:NUDIX hydrolase [Pseudomonas aeruginosa]
MKFCSLCGATVVQRIPDGDNRLRYVCDACHTVHYQNPRIVAGSLPAGFMENGETLAQAAARETEEEANARIGDLQLYTLFDLPHISQVYLFFRAELLDLDFSAGDESLEVRLFDEAEIPWSELAFPTIGRTLECYFSDRREGCFPVRNEAIAPMLASYKKD